MVRFYICVYLQMLKRMPFKGNESIKGRSRIYDRAYPSNLILLGRV